MIEFFDSATGNHPIFLGPFQVPFYHRRNNFYKVYFGDNDTRSKFYTEAVVQNMLMFFKIGVLKNFGGKHPEENILCWSFFLMKLQVFPINIETSPLICRANLSTGFYIIGKACNFVKKSL